MPSKKVPTSASPAAEWETRLDPTRWQVQGGLEPPVYSMKFPPCRRVYGKWEPTMAILAKPRRVSTPKV